MFKAILLIWIPVASNGQPSVMITQFPSIEKCNEAADEMDKTSAAEIQAGHIVNYMGGCSVKDFNESMGST